MITTIVLLILAVVTIMAGVTIVPNQYAIVVERLGRYHSTLTAGFHVLIPFIDRKAYRRSLKEEVYDVAAQTCITADNVTVTIDGVIYLQVVDAMKSAYGIEGYVDGAIQLAQTSLRSASAACLWKRRSRAAMKSTRKSAPTSTRPRLPGASRSCATKSATSSRRKVSPMPWNVR